MPILRMARATTSHLYFGGCSCGAVSSTSLQLPPSAPSSVARAVQVQAPTERPPDLNLILNSSVLLREVILSDAGEAQKNVVIQVLDLYDARRSV